jgi:hypothetical protein
MGEHAKPRLRKHMEPLTHPAIVCSGPQLDSVIEQLEAGTMPKPDEGAIWRPELGEELAVRLAKATGATDAMIAEQLAM